METIKNAYAEWIRAELQPNVYYVATVKQATKIFHENGVTWYRFDINTYEPIAARFIARLSRRIFGKTHFRRLI